MKYLDVDGIGKVSRIGLGTWQFGSREWGYGDGYASGTARDIVKRALALGITLFDTAEVYGLGKSERILGEALGDERAEVAVASKIMPIAPFPAVIKQRERASARRLQLDRIPLYQIHQPNPVVPDSVIMPGMRSLLDSGDIGAAGVSNYSLARWQRADAALGRPVISNQVDFSLARPGALEDLVPFAERENRIVIAYSPLAQGLLGGKYGLNNRPGGVRAVNSLFGTENLRRIEPLLQTLRDVAAEVDAKPAQVALAWLISLPGVVAIPGASSVEQLEFNVAAAEIELSAESRDALTDGGARVSAGVDEALPHRYGPRAARRLPLRGGCSVSNHVGHMGTASPIRRSSTAISHVSSHQEASNLISNVVGQPAQPHCRARVTGRDRSQRCARRAGQVRPDPAQRGFVECRWTGRRPAGRAGRPGRGDPGPMPGRCG